MSGRGRAPARALALGLALLALALLAAAGCDPLFLIEPSQDETATLHEGAITADETWRARDNPHKVIGAVVVAGPAAPTLTIEAGVRVLFHSGAGLTIGTRDEPGALQAVGTASEGIELMAEPQHQFPGYWAALTFRNAAAPSRLEHVTIRDCGRTEDFPTACLRAIGTGESLAVRDVTIAFSTGDGFAGIGGGFAPDSRGLRLISIRDAPIRIGPAQAGTLPADLSFGIGAERVIQVGGGRVPSSHAWPDLDMPFVVINTITVSGAASPTLEIRPGSELLFGRAGEIVVGGANGPGALRAEGTGAEPILFTSLGGRPGDWKGITFRANASPESLLSHAVVEFGGAATGFSKANITLFEDIGPVVRNSVIRGSDGCGIVRLGFDGVWTTDLTDPALGNSFSNNASAAQCTQR